MTDQENIVGLIYKRLSEDKKKLTKAWESPKNTNTRHLIIDNLLPDNLCNQIYESFPKKLHNFYLRKSFRERKRTLANLSNYNENINNAIYAFQNKKILDIISEITKINNLEADENLYAGGLSLMTKGDFLNPHIDNSHNITRDKYRRLNLLYYVTPGWVEVNGGNFELWDNKITKPKNITSLFNRMIIMETTRNSWHSVNKIISNQARCCVSNYYFSKESPLKINEQYFHVTSFTGRPNEKYKRAYGLLDNTIRNSISKILKFGRGRKLINNKKL
tara:strand:- start:283 stop:1110 length:828 start_codon:yes stop_codon:yes gene_type:complete